MQTTIDRPTDDIAPLDPNANPPYLTWLPGFSEADLEENEAGRLSAHQRDLLRADVDSQLVMTALGGLFFVGTALFSGGLVAAAIAACGFGAVIYHLVSRRRAEAGQTAVECADGDAVIRIVPGGEDPDEYLLEINDLTLATTKAVDQAFSPGGPYRVFYLPISQRVVAIKVLPGWRSVERPSEPPRAWWSRLPIHFTLGG